MFFPRFSEQVDGSVNQRPGIIWLDVWDMSSFPRPSGTAGVGRGHVIKPQVASALVQRSALLDEARGPYRGR